MGFIARRKNGESLTDDYLTDGHFFFDTIAAYLLNRRGSYVKASNS